MLYVAEAAALGQLRDVADAGGIVPACNQRTQRNPRLPIEY